MAHQFSPAVEQLIQERMASGQYASEEDLLLCALHSLADSEEELRAIREGLESVDRSDEGAPLDDAFGRLREKYQIRDMP